MSEVRGPLEIPRPLMEVWSTFDAMPMETLSKPRVMAVGGPRQRSIEELEADRRRYGASGNCFDLALWLRHRLREAGLEADIISDDISSRDAHVAVLSQVAGQAYLCDLGDMWLRPIAILTTEGYGRRGHFPAAEISLVLEGAKLAVTYHRPGGKAAHQSYDLRPVRGGELRDACEQNQGYVAQALVEMRFFDEEAHWEFEEDHAQWSRWSGLEPELMPLGGWAPLIAKRTGMKRAYVRACLEAYHRLRGR